MSEIRRFDTQFKLKPEKKSEVSALIMPNFTYYMTDMLKRLDGTMEYALESGVGDSFEELQFFGFMSFVVTPEELEEYFDIVGSIQNNDVEE